MKFLDQSSAIALMNQLGSERTPFLFIASFDTTKNIVVPLDEIDPLKIAYDFHGQYDNIADFKETYRFNNGHDYQNIVPIWQIMPPSFSNYQHAFSPLMAALKAKESHLANLTFPTSVKCNLTLPEIFARTTAKYRIFLKDHFCSFSPETFITIHDGVIATYPMKGTINAALPDAEKQLLENPKELDEHETVAEEAVRDIALVAENAHIRQFRYVDRVERGDGAILQTSSIIEGTLSANFHGQIGDILYRLLPAGSITGSPKQATTEILKQLETYDRGFYSGVAGIYDGQDLDSAVLIRYLEKERRTNLSAAIRAETAEKKPAVNVMQDQEILFHYTFKSGGGITAMSQAESEYDELIEKIYLPIS